MHRHIKKLTIFAILIGVCLYLFSPYIFGQQSKVYSLTIDGAISPANADYFVRGLDTAIDNNAEILVLNLNTPGGLDKSMRSMIQVILSSPVPVVIYISPKGARGASAGTYLMYASHIAAMAPATNLGSATPVSIGMIEPIKPNNDKKKQSDARTPQEIMHKKMLNDAQAYIRSLAQLRGRNETWAIKAVNQAANLSATEALEKNVIELIAYDQPELIKMLDQREVNLGNKNVILELSDPEIINLTPDWRTELLIVITDPSIAYLLLLAGIYGLIFEFLHPGGLLPGVIGAICLMVALYALNMLPINLAGLALLIIGIGLMVAEAFAPSFGVLGLGGIVAFTFGAFMLMEPNSPDYQIAPALIIASALFSGLILILMVSMILKARRVPLVTGIEELIDHQAIAVEDFNGHGRVLIRGEVWQANCEQKITKDQEVKVIAVDGLTLKVITED